VIATAPGTRQSSDSNGDACLSEWERCRPWIEAALEYTGGTHTLEDIEEAIAAGRMGLIALERSALIIEVHIYPRLKALHIFLAGGDLDELKSCDARMDATAKVLGCSRITIAGRRGFVRTLKDLGYRERWSVLAKEIP
jgi:hypothetical protein